MLKCVVCQIDLKGQQKKFCSTKCKNVDSNNKHQNYSCQKERSIYRKIELIKLNGDSCAACGYDTNYAALCFHHTDPKTKSFRLDARTLSNNSWENILEESAKCILLCHNCHMELHNPGHNSELLKDKGYDGNYTGKLIQPNKVKTPDREELQKKLFEKSHRKVGADYGVTDMVVRRWIRDLNLKSPPKGHWIKGPAHPRGNPNKPLKEELIKLRKEFSAEELAKRFSVTSKTIRKWTNAPD